MLDELNQQTIFENNKIDVLSVQVATIATVGGRMKPRQIGVPIPASRQTPLHTGQSYSVSNGRTTSTTGTTSRPLPVTRSNVASLARAIQSGSMNVVSSSPGTTTTSSSLIRARPSSRTRQVSPSRGSLPTTTTYIPMTSSSKYGTATVSTSPTRRISTDSGRSRLPSHDRSFLHMTKRYSNGSVNDPDHLMQSKGETSTMAVVPSSDRRFSHSPSPRMSISSAVEAKLMNGGMTGLQNLGNTCFMNSVLQCLSNTKPLLLFCFNENLDDFFNTSTTSVMKGVLMREYASLIRKMWLSSESRPIVSPSSFKNTIGRFAPRFLGYAEQDSQEFLRYLLQGLHEDVNRVQRKPAPVKIDEKADERLKEKDRAKANWDRYLTFDNSAIVEIFVGQLKSTLECCHCQYQSITFDMFWDLSIPLPRGKSSTTLQECIQLFMSKEDLDGNERPMCAKCKQKRHCTKKFSIQKCPDILVLHLKRFSQARGRTKLNTHIDFPVTNLRLDELTDVMSDSYEGPVPSYNLFGVSNHSGTVYSGHYIAQGKHPFTEKWHEFNDSSVYALNSNSQIVTSNAYVLFYELNKTH